MFNVNSKDTRTTPEQVIAGQVKGVLKKKEKKKKKKRKENILKIVAKFQGNIFNGVAFLAK